MKQKSQVRSTSESEGQVMRFIPHIGKFLKHFMQTWNQEILKSPDLS